MKQRKVFCLAIFFALVLVGCGSDSDDGGTVGGSELVQYCERDAGVYNYADGSQLEIMPNCEFTMSMPDGNNAHGKVNSVGEDGSISLDMIIDSGPAAGTCATVSGAPPNNFTMTNVHQCG